MQQLHTQSNKVNYILLMRRLLDCCCYFTKCFIIPLLFVLEMFTPLKKKKKVSSHYNYSNPD